MKVIKTVKNGVTIMTVIPGNTVLCDLCNEDYTNSDEKKDESLKSMSVEELEKLLK